jgi:probable F420-dependent oxidoreductase
MRFWASAAFFAPDDYLALAPAIEAAGIEGMLLSDHIFFPRQLGSPYPYSSDGRPGWAPDTPFPDCWVTIGAMAAVTSRLRFSTSVYIAPSRDLCTVARLVGTAAVLSDNRVALGLGAGWMREEFVQTGQEFTNRGRRLDEMISALRALWRSGWVEHHGDHYDIGPVQMAPAPTAPVPIWCGGYSEAARRRATLVCDGWIGVATSPEEGRAVVADLLERRARSPRVNEPFEIILSLPTPIDVDVAQMWAEAGVTGLICRPWARALRPDITDLAAAQGEASTDDKAAAVTEFGAQVVASFGDTAPSTPSR